MYRETLDRDAINSFDSRAALIRDPVRRLRFLRRMTAQGLPTAHRPLPRGWSGALLAVCFFAFPAGYRTETNAPLSVPVSSGTLPDQVPTVWLVDKAEEYETYSNGLRVENMPPASTHPRSYLVWPVHARAGTPQRRTAPAGIVFHTTESQQLEFEERRTTALKLVGKYLLDYVVANRCYHFVVDRFGRVHRVIEESDAANHAGWSVWAEEQWIYVNLNESFLGVAFEAQSRPGGNGPSVNAAQEHAGRVLVEMLRSRYGIAAINCVTHAQVSVNPASLRLGYHTDWAEGFPFRALGLPDNYARPPAGVLLFGLDADGYAGGSGVGRGVLAAETQLRREALSRRVPLAEHRRVLRSRWRETLSALESCGSEKEKEL